MTNLAGTYIGVEKSENQIWNSSGSNTANWGIVNNGNPSIGRIRQLES